MIVASFILIHMVLVAFNVSQSTTYNIDEPGWISVPYSYAISEMSKLQSWLYTLTLISDSRIQSETIFVNKYQEAIWNTSILLIPKLWSCQHLIIKHIQNIISINRSNAFHWQTKRLFIWRSKPKYKDMLNTKWCNCGN